MCDLNPEKPAVFQYLWPWGERGYCSAEGAMLLNQRAEALNRTIQIVAIPDATPAPITRDERIALHAKILTLEAELEESKSRGLELYRTNTRLLERTQLLELREREARAIAEDAQALVTRLEGELAARDTEHASLLEQLERLRALESFVNAPEERRERIRLLGLEPPGAVVVDGPLGDPGPDDNG
jgi:hypothetical protein